MAAGIGGLVVMSDSNEQISALIDGELKKREMRALLDRMTPAERDRWERYHLLQDVLRHDVSSPVPRLAARVADRIMAEPSHHTRPMRTLRPSGGVWRQAAGFAVAASVTAVAIFGVQSLNETDGPMTPMRADAGAVAPVEPASVAPADRLPDLDTYLVEHNEYAASPGMQGVLPYVRLVGHR